MCCYISKGTVLKHSSITPYHFNINTSNFAYYLYQVLRWIQWRVADAYRACKTSSKWTRFTSTWWGAIVICCMPCTSCSATLGFKSWNLWKVFVLQMRVTHWSKQRWIDTQYHHSPLKSIWCTKLLLILFHTAYESLGQRSTWLARRLLVPLWRHPASSQPRWEPTASSRFIYCRSQKRECWVVQVSVTRSGIWLLQSYVMLREQIETD